jgi:D-glycero-D-manno-heptose 1,7-bisphosphate phosphatase
MEKQPVVFLDRDGTLNVEIGYIRNVDDLVLIEGAADAVRKLNQSGIAAILVTNQTGAARGYYAESHIHALNARLLKLLKENGAHLDYVYYCPHLEEGIVEPFNRACACRKPAAGMVEQAYAEHPQLDKTKSFVIGDKASDVELAQNCGARGILVTTGYGEAVLKGEYQHVVKPDFQAPSIVEAVDWILAQVQVAR